MARRADDGRVKAGRIDRPELEWRGATSTQLSALAAWLKRQGEGGARARGLVAAIVLDDFDALSSASAATYRRLLRAYGPPKGGGLKNADNPRRGELMATAA